MARIWILRAGPDIPSMPKMGSVVAILLGLNFLIGLPSSRAAEFPQAQISNGQIIAKMYLPDAKKGYYRSTRFDWSGAVYSLRYKGHDFYGPWYDRIDPKVINWVFQGSDIVSGPCSVLTGPHTSTSGIAAGSAELKS